MILRHHHALYLTCIPTNGSYFNNYQFIPSASMKPDLQEAKTYRKRLKQKLHIFITHKRLILCLDYFVNVTLTLLNAYNQYNATLGR